MQVRIRTNSLEFEFAPNSLESLDPMNSNSKSKISNFCIVLIFQFLQAGCVYFSEPKNDHHAGLLLTCYYPAYSESLWVNRMQQNQGKWSPLT